MGDRKMAGAQKQVADPKFLGETELPFVVSIARQTKDTAESISETQNKFEMIRTNLEGKSKWSDTYKESFVKLWKKRYEGKEAGVEALMYMGQYCPELRKTVEALVGEPETPVMKRAAAIRAKKVEQTEANTTKDATKKKPARQGEGIEEVKAITPERVVSEAETEQKAQQELKGLFETWAQKLKKAGYEKLFFTLSGAGASSIGSKTGNYLGWLEAEGPDKRALIGFKGLTENEYGLSYEVIGRWKRENGVEKEWEVTGKDVLADVLNFGGEKRLANVKAATRSPGFYMSGNISPETGVFSYAYFKAAKDGSVMSNVIGGRSVLDVIYEKRSEKKFFEYSSSLAVFQSLAQVYDKGRTIGAAVQPDILPPQEGSMLVEIRAMDEKTRKTKLLSSNTYDKDSGPIVLYEDGKGGKIVVTLSGPKLEKRPDQAPQILIAASLSKLKMVDGKITEVELTPADAPDMMKMFPINTETRLINKNVIISVQPTQDAFNEMKAELAKLPYTLMINDGLPITITPSIEPKQVVHDPKSGADFSIQIAGISPRAPVMSSNPPFYMSMMVTNESKKNAAGQSEFKTDEIELGRDGVFIVGGSTIKIKPNFPPNVTMSLNTEGITEQVRLRNDELIAKDLSRYVRQTWGYRRSGVDLPLTGKSIVSVEGQFLAETPSGLQKTVAEQQRKETEGTRKEKEVATERAAGAEALGTAFGFNYQNMTGLRAEVVNTKGHGLTLEYRNDLPYIGSGITSAGETLERARARTKKFGPQWVGLTGLTFTNWANYGLETENNREQLNKLRSETAGVVEGELDLGWRNLAAARGGFTAGGGKAEERRTVGLERAIAGGQYWDALFRAAHPGWEGGQLYTLNWHTEKLEGATAGKGSVVVDRARLFYDVGYLWNANTWLFDKLALKTSVENTKDLYRNEYTMFSPLKTPVSASDFAETVVDRYNPRIVTTGPPGSFTLGYRGMTQKDSQISSNLTTKSSMTGKLRQDAYDFLALGVPFFNEKLKFNATFTGEFTEQNRLTIDTMNTLYHYNQSYTKYEIQPMGRLGEWTLSMVLGTELTNNESETLYGSTRSRTETNRSRFYAQPGASIGNFIELRANFMTDNERTATETMGQLYSTYRRSTALSLTGTGKLPWKDMTFDFSGGWQGDKTPSTATEIWHINAKLRWAFAKL